VRRAFVVLARALAAALAFATAACAPTVRAGDYYATPLRQTAAPRAPHLEARWRVQPAPAGCAATGAPIVFVPALGLTQHSWAGVTAALGACRPRVLVDLPGVGEAPPENAFDEAAVLQALVDVVDAVAPGGGRVVLAGHSLGGAIAARLAARLGARVEALVLVAAPVAPFALDRWERLLLRSSLWPPFLHLAGAWSGVAHGLTRVSAGGERASALDVALIADGFSDHRRRAAIAQYYRVFLDPRELVRTEAALASLRGPALLVWGGADAIVPLDVLHAAQQRLPQATTRIVPGVGHLVPQSAPRAVADAIDRFLATVPSPAQSAIDGGAVVTDGARRPGDRVWGPGRELFPLVGVGALFPLDGRVDLSFNAGVARGGVDPRFPVESGRLALTVGAAIRGDAAAGWQFAYLRATGRFELIWRWGGGYHIDGTLLVDPRNGRVGGYGALGYSPSVLPWVRAFVGGGALPGEGGRLLVGVDVTARLTGWLW
jgi:pimeloyl-ACP methyl ester carboxylesterase